MPGPPVKSVPQPVLYYAEKLDEQYPGTLSGTNITLGEAYLNYISQHPNANPKLIYEEVVARLTAVGNIPKAIAKSVGSAAGVISGAGQAAGKGLAQVGQDLSLPGFLGMLTNPNFWLRLAEGAVGLILLAVGLNAVLKQSTGIDVTKAIPKVVPI